MELIHSSASESRLKTGERRSSAARWPRFPPKAPPAGGSSALRGGAGTFAAPRNRREQSRLMPVATICDKSADGEPQTGGRDSAATLFSLIQEEKGGRCSTDVARRRDDYIVCFWFLPLGSSSLFYWHKTSKAQ